MNGTVARIALLALLVPAAPSAPAQGWPSKPIRLIVPFPAGATTDFLARVVADKIGPALGQTVVVENRAGAAGNVGTDLVAKSVPDGYTVVMGTVAQTISETLYTKLPFSIQRDLAPVALVARVPNVMEVHPSVPAKTVKEYIALARARPGQITFVSGGSGTSVHMSGEMLKMMTGIDIVHVPYKGAAPALVDLVGGHVMSMFDNLPSSMPHIRSGRLRALAVTTAQRYAALPDLPTVAEAGVPGYEASSWFGILGPAAMPREALARLNAEVNRAIRLPDVQERLAQEGAIVAPISPEEFGAFIRTEVAKWAKVVKASGAKAD